MKINIEFVHKITQTGNFLIMLFSMSIFPAQTPSFGQINPDKSLGKDQSVISPIAPNVNLIGGGALRGANLLHSFSQFDINNGNAAYFVDPGVKNIVGRVTGGNLSKIYGLVGVKGNANLFILNPYGFIFGANSKIDINGAFIVSTGKSP